MIGWTLLIFCQGPLVLLELYMYMWLSTFSGQNGFTDDDVDYYYQTQGVVGPVLTFALLYFFGHLVDKMNSKISIPCAFIFRAFIMSSCYMINDPTK